MTLNTESPAREALRCPVWCEDALELHDIGIGQREGSVVPFVGHSGPAFGPVLAACELNLLSGTVSEVEFGLDLSETDVFSVEQLRTLAGHIAEALAWADGQASA